MFNIFKKKENKIEKIYSPFKGNLVNLEDVPDEVFAQKLSNFFHDTKMFSKILS